MFSNDSRCHQAAPACPSATQLPGRGLCRPGIFGWTLVALLLTLVPRSPVLSQTRGTLSGVAGSAEPPPGLATAARVAAAWRAYYDQSPAIALPLFKALVSENPERADVHFGLGRCLLEVDQISQARDQFEQAARIDPSRAEYRFYLGLTWYQEEAYARAVAVWETVEASLSEDTVLAAFHRDTVWLMGRALLAQGDVVRASRYFEEAMTRLGAFRDGHLVRPDPELERTANGNLPGDRWEPLPGRLELPSDQRIAFACRGAIWAVRGGGCLRERLTTPPEGWHDDLPSQRPGDGRLAFIATDPRGRPWLMSQDANGQRTQLVDGPVLPVTPTWSVKGDMLAFCRLGDDPPEPRIAVLDVATGHVRDLDVQGMDATEPDFGAGGRVVFTAAQGDVAALATFDLATGHTDFIHRLVVPTDDRAPTARAGRPPREWTGRGGAQKPRATPLPVSDPWAESVDVGVSARREARGDRGSSPDKTRTDGSKSRDGIRGAKTPIRLPVGAEPDLSPVDSDLVVFTRRARGQRRVYVLSITEKTARPLSPENRDCYSPAFSPDGVSVVYVCRQDGVARLEVQRRGEYRSHALYEQNLTATAPDWVELEAEGAATPGAGTAQPAQ